MQMIKPISITAGVPYELLPLVFIVFVTAIKDIFEDRKRHKFDNDENNKIVEVYNR